MNRKKYRVREGKISMESKYTMEELLPVTAYLAEKYTSKESSSVTYETAQMLMEAVCYCIRENEEKENPWEIVTFSKEKEMAADAYQKGYEKILEKTRLAKEAYELLTENFEDYGCINYRDTVLKGLPEFFLHYDPVFSPQNHILTLDYPVLEGMIQKKCGIDLIFLYIKNLLLEERFLAAFDRQTVAELLEEICPDYREIYLDNICYAVLYRSVECFLADRSCLSLQINREDMERIRECLSGEEEEETERQVQNFIRLMAGRIADGDLADYLLQSAHDITVRLRNRI